MEEKNRDLLSRLLPGQEKDFENDTEVNTYLDQISSFGIEKLRMEESRIREEITHTLQQTQDLAFQNYKTFVQTAECSSDVLKDFTNVEERLTHLLEELPEFSARCAAFGRLGAGIQARRRLNSTTLAKHTELLEVLELPQLMDTCVRNQYYDQAMDLVSHVRSMEKKHGNIPLVASIVSDVQQAYRLMLTQLVSQLRTNIQLPQCLKVVGHLRRMEVYTEFELRLKFLQARNAWFEEQLSSISRDDAYHHISKTIEVSRVGLFDIVTQYRAVFSDESALLTSSADDLPPAIFHEWINLKVDQFLETLRADLARGVGPRLDSLLSQTMYFGLSLARIGADLRPLAVPIFQQAALQQFGSAVSAATGRFRNYMDTFTFMRSRGGQSGSALEVTSAAQDELHPPLSLLDFLPLAHYCNGLLAAFNELRLCPALGLVHRVTELLEQSVTSVISHTVDLYHTDSQGLTEAERLNYGRFCTCLARDLVPYLSRCLAAVYPPTELADVLGIPAPALEKRGIGSLDVAHLTAPLSEFIAEEAVPADLTTSLQELKLKNDPQAEDSATSALVTASGMEEATAAASMQVSDSAEVLAQSAPSDRLADTASAGEVATPPDSPPDLSAAGEVTTPPDPPAGTAPVGEVTTPSDPPADTAPGGEVTIPSDQPADIALGREVTTPPDWPAGSGPDGEVTTQPGSTEATASDRGGEVQDTILQQDHTPPGDDAGDQDVGLLMAIDSASKDT